MDTPPLPLSPDLVDTRHSPLAGLMEADTAIDGFSDRTLAAIARWPNVPALFGWLELDPRGRWWLGGGLIENPNIVRAVNRHYRADEQGRWYFQNGPQKGFVKLHIAPLVLGTTAGGDGLEAHTGVAVSKLEAVLLDEQGGLWARTDLGPAVFGPEALAWALERLRVAAGPGAGAEAATALGEDDLATAMTLPDGAGTGLALYPGVAGAAADGVPVTRLDAARAPAVLGFVPDPQPDLAGGEPPVEACLPDRAGAAT